MPAHTIRDNIQIKSKYRERGGGGGEGGGGGGGKWSGGDPWHLNTFSFLGQVTIATYN